MRVQSLFTKTGASFSSCNKYRYDLWRVWDSEKPTVLFVMLNPSTADAEKNDPTVERCQRRAEALGFGGFHVANIFAYRSTDPMVLYKLLGDPIGPGNDLTITMLAGICSDMVICGWGRHGNLLNRGNDVLKIIRKTSAVPHALKINCDGTPSHPLYLPYSAKPVPMP